jgi:hypothetical protein
MRLNRWAALVSCVLLGVWVAPAAAEICLLDDQGTYFRLDINSRNGGFGGVWKSPTCPHQGTLVGSIQQVGSTIYFGWTGYHVPDASCNPKEYHGVWSGNEGTGTWFSHSRTRINLYPCWGGAAGIGNAIIAINASTCPILGGVAGTPISLFTEAATATGSFRMSLTSCPIPE